MLKEADSQGDTPIIIAAKSGHWHLVHQFIEMDESLMATRAREGSTLLHLIPPHVDLFKRVAEYDLSLLQAQDAAGEYPIHRCIWNGWSLEIFHWMIAQDSSLVRVETHEGNLPIHLAAEYGYGNLYHPLVVWMVEQDPELLKVRNQKGELPIHCAARGSNHYLVRWMLKQDASLALEKTREHQLPIHLMRWYEGTDLLLEMFREHPQLIFEKDQEGRLPIHYATESGNFELVEQLLEQAKVKC